MQLISRLMLLVVVALLVSCGGGGNSDVFGVGDATTQTTGTSDGSDTSDTSGTDADTEDNTDGPSSGFALRGAAEGLQSTATLTLQEVGSGQTLEIDGDGAFVFAEGFSDGVNYDVSVKTQPSGQNCSVGNNTGTFSDSEISNVSIVCIGSSGYTLELAGFQTVEPSFVIAGIRVEDIASGVPVKGLTASDFSVLENDSVIGDESFLDAEQISEERINVSTVLILDVSTSIDSEEMTNIKIAAKAALFSEDAEGVKTSKLYSGRQQVAIYTFDSDVELLVDFTSDLDALETAIDSIPNSVLQRGNSTNLLEAVEIALGRWEVTIGLGSLEHGYAILLTDGIHNSDGKTAENIVSSFTNEYGVRKALYAIAVGDGVSIENLTQLTGDATRVYTVNNFDDTSDLIEVLTQIADEALAQTQGLYRVYYASPKRSGNHEVVFAVAGNFCSDDLTCTSAVGSSFDSSSFDDAVPALYAILTGGVEQIIGTNLIGDDDFLVVEADLRWVNLMPSFTMTIGSLVGTEPVETLLSDFSRSYQFPTGFTSAVINITETGTGFVANVSLIRGVGGVMAVSDSAVPSGTASYTLTRLVSDGPWQFGQQAAGMTVDADDNVYLANGDTLWVYDGSTTSIYLGPSDGAYNFEDVDIDADGLLYIFDGATVGGDILTSTVANTSTVLRTFNGVTFPSFMAVVDASQIVVTGRDGLHLITDSSTTLAHDSTAFKGSTDCATEDLVIQRSGAFLYQPGCNGNNIVMGDLTSTVPRTIDLGDTFNNMLCSARDPAGGFYSVIDFDSGYRLVHWEEDATADSGWSVLSTSPSINDAAEETELTSGFRYCALAASPSGKIYYQTFTDLWVFEPVVE